MCFFLFLLCLCGIPGCTGNVVTFSYPLIRDDAPAPVLKNISVCIVDFANQWETAAIGERLDGSPILPRTPVGRWLAASLAAELAHAGYTVSVAESFSDARAKGADYIVTGEAEEVWLAETSLTRFTGTIRASISLLDAEGNRITRNGYSSVYSKSVLPIYGVPQTLLDEALAEMLHPAARLLCTTMQ